MRCPRLRKMLQNKQTQNAVLAVELRGYIGPAAKDATPDLIEFLRVEGLGDAACRALGKIGPPTLLARGKAMQSRNELVQRRAADALGLIGVPAIPTNKL